MTLNRSLNKISINVNISGGPHRLGQFAGLLGRVQDLIEEDREVEGQAQTDGVSGLHVALADVKR